MGALQQVGEVMRSDGARRSGFLGALETSDLLTLLDASTVETAPSGAEVLGRGSGADELHLVLDGDVLEQSVQGDGAAFARPVAPGGIVGLTDVLTAIPLPRRVTALRTTTTLRVPGEAMRRLLDAPSIASAVVALLRDALRAAEADRVLLTTGDASSKVARRLAELADGWGRWSARGLEITLPLTQEQLGHWSGTSRETVVACLHDLREHHVLETGRRHITVLDPAALAAAAHAGAIALGTGTHMRDLGIPRSAGR